MAKLTKKMKRRRKFRKTNRRLKARGGTKFGVVMPQPADEHADERTEDRAEEPTGESSAGWAKVAPEVGPEDTSISLRDAERQLEDARRRQNVFLQAFVNDAWRDTCIFMGSDKYSGNAPALNRSLFDQLVLGSVGGYVPRGQAVAVAYDRILNSTLIMANALAKTGKLQRIAPGISEEEHGKIEDRNQILRPILYNRVERFIRSCGAIVSDEFANYSTADRRLSPDSAFVSPGGYWGVSSPVSEGLRSNLRDELATGIGSGRGGEQILKDYVRKCLAVFQKDKRRIFAIDTAIRVGSQRSDHVLMRIGNRLVANLRLLTTFFTQKEFPNLVGLDDQRLQGAIMPLMTRITIGVDNKVTVRALDGTESSHTVSFLFPVDQGNEVTWSGPVTNSMIDTIFLKAGVQRTEQEVDEEELDKLLKSKFFYSAVSVLMQQVIIKQNEHAFSYMMEALMQYIYLIDTRGWSKSVEPKSDSLTKLRAAYNERQQHVVDLEKNVVDLEKKKEEEEREKEKRERWENSPPPDAPSEPLLRVQSGGSKDHVYVDDIYQNIGAKQPTLFNLVHLVMLKQLYSIQFSMLKIQTVVTEAVSTARDGTMSLIDTIASSKGINMHPLVDSLTNIYKMKNINGLYIAFEKLNLLSDVPEVETDAGAGSGAGSVQGKYKASVTGRPALRGIAFKGGTKRSRRRRRRRRTRKSRRARK